MKTVIMFICFIFFLILSNIGQAATFTMKKTADTIDGSFSDAAANAVLANMYFDSAMAYALNALDDPSYYPLASLYASASYDYAEDAYNEATAALTAAGQDYTFWGYYAPVYAEADINVRSEAVTNIDLAAQYAAQGDFETAAYYLGYGFSLAATADLYNGSTIWCASMESSAQSAAQQSSETPAVESSANGSSTFSSAATNAVLANMNFATALSFVYALEDPSYLSLIQLYASTAYDYSEDAYNDATAALASAGQDYTFWGYYAAQYAESDMNNKADALSYFDQAVQAYQAGNPEAADYYLVYGLSASALADLYNATTIWCASMESASVPVGINPVSGEWIGSAGFGDLSFTVDSTSTGITEITWSWIDFICDGIKLNGSRTRTYAQPEPIINGEFPIVELSPFVTSDPSSKFSMTGTFDASGTNASGTYEAVVFGTTCTGTWDASSGGSVTEIDWVGEPRVEHGASAKKFYQSFVVLGSSGNVPITATCKNSSGNILDELTENFPVKAGEEYEITVNASVLGMGRSPSPDSDDVIFSSSSASSSTWSSIGDCTATQDDVTGFWYYACATDYSITDINIQLVP